MNLYIIRIKDNYNSTKAAKRCYDSIESFYGKNDHNGLEYLEYWDATTPKDNPKKILEENGVKNLKGCVEPYSRWDNVISAFTSHFSIWKRIIERDTPGIIFEHDAVVVDSLPISIIEKMSSKGIKKKTIKPHISLKSNKVQIMNIGHPSYGKFNTPEVMGLNSLTSKRYFPGAHAYYVSPEGARQLIEVAKKDARPTDVFINYDRFTNLYEWYPWPVLCKDNFSTIQNERGCLAKHNYSRDHYALIPVE